MELTEKEIKHINTKNGLMALLNQEGELDFQKAVRFVKYENRLSKLHEELIRLQSWVVANKKKVVIFLYAQLLKYCIIIAEFRHIAAKWNVGICPVKFLFEQLSSENIIKNYLVRKVGCNE